MPKKKTAKKKCSGKKKSCKKAFGGYTISFKGCNDPIEKIFGSCPMPPSQMTKVLWSYVKRHHLNTK